MNSVKVFAYKSILSENLSGNAALITFCITEESAQRAKLEISELFIECRHYNFLDFFVLHFEFDWWLLWHAAEFLLQTFNTFETFSYEFCSKMLAKAQCLSIYLLGLMVWNVSVLCIEIAKLGRKKGPTWIGFSVKSQTHLEKVEIGHFARFWLSICQEDSHTTTKASFFLMLAWPQNQPFWV